MKKMFLVMAVLAMVWCGMAQATVTLWEYDPGYTTGWPALRWDLTAGTYDKIGTVMQPDADAYVRYVSFYGFKTSNLTTGYVRGRAYYAVPDGSGGYYPGDPVLAPNLVQVQTVAVPVTTFNGGEGYHRMALYAPGYFYSDTIYIWVLEVDRSNTAWYRTYGEISLGVGDEDSYSYPGVFLGTVTYNPYMGGWRMDYGHMGGAIIKLEGDWQ
jgi:hypothetical protein